MVTRAEKIGRKRPKHAMHAPLAPYCFEVLAEVPSALGAELAMLAHQVFLAAGVEGFCLTGSAGALFPLTVASHVTERRTAALNEAPADLLADLQTLMALLGPTPPVARDVASASTMISEWARTTGHSRTAALFAEAAAATCPDDPEAAFLAGRANRVIREYWRAELYYRRAIRLAYRLLRWDIYIRAHLGLGRMMADTGRLDIAEEMYARAASVAETEGSEWLAAQTYHDLLVLNFDSGDLETALDYAFKAIRTYPLHNERFPLAVHDMAFLLVAQGHAAEALPMLDAVVRAPIDAEYQLLVAGTFARAAGLLGRNDLVTTAEGAMLQLVPRFDRHAAFAMLNLAVGFRALQQWDLALRYAQEALRLAGDTEIDYVLQHAPTLICEILGRVPAPPPPPRIGSELARELHSVAETLEGRVAAWHTGPGWNAKTPQNGPGSLGLV